MELRTAIVGTKFRGEDAIKVLGEMGQGAVVTLKHEADNEHDENAVAVYGSGTHLGYIPRAHNHALADALKRGATITGRITTEAIVDKGDVKFAPKITVSWGTAPDIGPNQNDGPADFSDDTGGFHRNEVLR
jgi:hypothetical protein